ncbi:very short patch repair endonuclease [Zestomonas thermotolerans]|uniref:very short patch repair endonuclease n=1 Tax=Zestomonas thermotolerans TaxID=157784 RepID=UPI0003680798|nr:very short patch repair endonuclease [Pseudomonas thermotolerans]
MPDLVTTAKRSEIMRAVKSADTGPEIAVRKMLHRLGYRYRLHRRDLPGTPDIVFPGRRKVVFVHGCFWHGHLCRYGRLPRSKIEYWQPKIEANRKRDVRKLRELRRAGWEALVVWQCELKHETRVVQKLVSFLGPSGRRV